LVLLKICRQSLRLAAFFWAANFNSAECAKIIVPKNG